MTNTKKSGFFKWLLPDARDAAVYLLIIALSFILSNITNLQRLSDYSGELNIRGSIFNFLNSALVQLFGEQVASRLTNALFWGIVGLFTYLALNVLRSFFSRVGEDLEISHFKYPPGADRFGQLKHFLIECLVRIAATISLILFLKFTAQLFFEQWIEAYQAIGTTWPPDLPAILNLSWTLLAHFAALHCIVLLIRLILLRQRAFGL